MPEGGVLRHAAFGRLLTATKQRDDMYDYGVFGGCLRSEIELPELPSIRPQAADWTLRVARSRPSSHAPELLGEYPVGEDFLRLYRHRLGFRLEYVEIGSFDISHTGADIVWYPAPSAPRELVTAAVVGPILALILHLSGMLCLHGSAVALRGGAVAFLAPKYHGKSTLALAIATAGGHLITDDTLAVDPGSPPTARPGVHTIKLWTDSAERLGGDRLPGTLLDGNKKTLTGLPASMLSHEQVPLDTVYVLCPVRAVPGQAPVARIRLEPVPATTSLIRSTKLGELLGASESGTLLLRAGALARTTPVYALMLARDFQQLPEAVEQLLEWHPATQPASPLVGAST